MRLRNKKTGEIGEAYWATFREGGTDLCISMHKNGAFVEVHSLAELNEEWEDAPAEPLIKDEKIRKAVRAWAEANDLLTFKVVNEHFNCFKIIGYGDHNISSRIEFKSTIAHANKDQFYTIDELCGTPEPLEPAFIDLDERIKEKEEE